MVRRFIAIILLLTIWGACFSVQAAEPTPAPNFRNLPGITQEEITAIEALQAENRDFVYGAVLSSEAVFDENRQFIGFAASVCELLSQMFEIKVIPQVYGWGELMDGLDNHSIDFSGELTSVPDGQPEAFMSEPIAMRSLSLFYRKGRKTLDEITALRTPTLGFLRGSINESLVKETSIGVFETALLDNTDDASEALRRGEIDALVSDNVFEPALGTTFSESFSPFIIKPVALSTKNPKLEPIISVFNKFMQSGGQTLLSEQYKQGMNSYIRTVLRKQLAYAEKKYIDEKIASGEKIPVILESGNYPISFFNKTSGRFEGIVPDLLDQVTALTGLEFECVNDPTEDWASVLAKLESGRAALISELLYTPAREGKFLWPEQSSCVTHYALLSKSDAHNLEYYQMLGKRIGVEEGTAYQTVAGQWFPSTEIKTYNDIDLAFQALDSGEIDLIMASENMLLSQTNYNEKTGYKVNFTIDYTAESKPGFNIEQGTLLSIFNKTYPFTESETIVRNWMSRVFDYSAQLSKSRVELLVVSTALLMAFMVLLGVFLFKNSRHRRDLSSLVTARTAQLEEKTATLSTIYNAIPDLLYSKDLEGRYTSCNPSFEKFVGLPESEVLGKFASEVFRSEDSEVLAQGNDQEQEVLCCGNSSVVEQALIGPDGEPHLMETIKTSLCQNGAIVGTMGVARDITAHKAAQQAAQAASKAKSSFLARMSHEIRTPLNAIVGMAEITKASLCDPDKMVSSVNQIIVSSQHLLSLINDVLDMSKIESGNLEILAQPFSLKEALDETLTIISPRCAEKSIVFESNAGDLAEMMLVGDKLRLKQVLINLLSNATKFTDLGGSVSLQMNIPEETADDIRIQFVVKDSGIGMSQEQIDRLFRPFEQADSSIASRFGGTGLGLSISQSLVQRMGGNITIDSTMGEGSSFAFTLSFPKSDSPLPTAKESPQELDFSGERILLAEDIELNRVIVQELLAPTKLQIDIATNGREAVEMFEKSEPGAYRLIFMDIQMPELNGYEATARIRALEHPHARDIPIIAMTANAYKEDVEQAFDAGMNGHIGKPIDIGELTKILAAYLREPDVGGT